jgi:hypothetical protein
MNPINKVLRPELLPFSPQATGERLIHVGRGLYMLRSVMDARVIAKADANSALREAHKIDATTQNDSKTSHASNFALKEVILTQPLTPVDTTTETIASTDSFVEPEPIAASLNEAPVIETIPEMTERQREAEVADLERRMRVASALELIDDAHVSGGVTS